MGSRRVVEIIELLLLAFRRFGSVTIASEQGKGLFDYTRRLMVIA